MFDVKRRAGRPDVILLKIDGARKQASFWVDLSRHAHIARTYGLVYENNSIMLLASSLYALALGAAKTTLNEAYNRGIIPWPKISNDGEVVRRVLNGEISPKPSNCSDDCWSVICKMWAKSPKDRPTFAELKHLLAEQSFCSSNTLLTQLLSRTSAEFGTVEREFINGWLNEYRQKIRVEEIYKIHHASLESRYQQFVRSNPKYATQECIGWHGTSSNCRNGQCKSLSNYFARILKGLCTWGEATYYATQSFACHTYNGDSQSQMHNGTAVRCTIIVKLNRGIAFSKEKYTRFRLGTSSDASIPALITMFKHETANFSRDYYICPVEYILSYNGPECLGSYRYPDTTNYNGISRDLNDCGLVDLTPEFLQELASGNI
ncbi:unnamed protein product [Adineta ricciae]|uniref:Serine-threonine/tyrosine-protein kinase catalytic domain-containing protein n=1 Tax=Adineta ricciae TaxID=249248 RepID=A0A815V6H2_ADIRI|nr:unnamed protein product [Adineta ricciae]